MNNFWNIGKLSFIISIALFTGVSFVSAQSADELAESIASSNQKLVNLEIEADKIKLELSKVGSEKASLNRELALINTERKSLENNINQTRTKIDLLGSEIKKTEDQIFEHSKTIITQSKFLENILRRVNQQESFTLLERMLSMGNLSDLFLVRDQYLSLQKPIYEYTGELRNNKIYLARNRSTLNNQQTQLESETEKLSDQKVIIFRSGRKKKDVLDLTKNKEALYQQNLQKHLR